LKLSATLACQCLILSICSISEKYDLPIVDMYFRAGGAICQPLKWETHILAVESATKWIVGHGTTMGGVIVVTGTFEGGAMEKISDLRHRPKLSWFGDERCFRWWTV
jgi:O-acetylhomoserine/O-acetylserine sulfhydrylase-like pyridoxal-dependent enzyme